MPTGRDYRNVIASLQAYAQQVDRCWCDHGSAMDAVLLNGPCRATIDERKATGAQVVQALLEEIEEQIRVARFRASVCDRYTQAMHRYYRSNDPTAVPPPRPAPWASAGW